MNTKKKWTPDEDDLETCDKVLAWLIDWMHENEPKATQSIQSLEQARREIPENIEELE